MIELVAHGGTAGIVLEAGLPLVVLTVFVAVWIRERRARISEGEESDEANVRRPLFRDEEEGGE